MEKETKNLTLLDACLLYLTPKTVKNHDAKNIYAVRVELKHPAKKRSYQQLNGWLLAYLRVAVSIVNGVIKQNRGRD